MLFIDGPTFNVNVYPPDEIGINTAEPFIYVALLMFEVKPV